MIPHDKKTSIDYDNMKIYREEDIPELVERFINHVSNSIADKNRDNVNNPILYSAVIGLPAPVYKPSGFYEVCNMAEEHARGLFPLFQDALQEYTNVKKSEYIAKELDIEDIKAIRDFQAKKWLFSEFKICAVSTMSWTYTVYLTVYDLNQYKENYKVLSAKNAVDLINNTKYLRDLYIYYSNGVMQKFMEE